MVLENESSIYLQTCSLLNAKEEIIIKYPSKGFLINRISVCVFQLLLIIPTVTLNGLSFITIMKRPHLREKICYFLIMLQSVSDLTVGLVSLPALSILGFVTIATKSAHCVEQVLFSRLIPLLLLISIVTLFTMTMERYVGVLHPFRYRTLITKKRILVFHFCATSLVFTTVALSIILSDALLGNALSLSMFILLAVAVFVYTKIFKTIRNREKIQNALSLNNVRAPETSAANRQSKRNFLKEARVVKSCYLAVVCFIVCFLGGIAATFPSSLGFFNKNVLNHWALTLAMLNSSINSIVFFWKRPLLRIEARNALQNLC